MPQYGNEWVPKLGRRSGTLRRATSHRQPRVNRWSNVPSGWRLGSQVGQSLWIDDHPEGNRIERRMLRQMGIFTEAVTTSAGAAAVLDDPANKIDLIITDVGRDDGSPGGLALLEGIGGRRPVILYVGRVDRNRVTPAGAFGITDRPDELLNLVMDALDR